MKKLLLFLAALPLTAQISDHLIPASNAVTSTITTAANSAVAIPFTGMGCVGIVVSGTWAGSLLVQQSNDGVLWQPADVLQQLVGKWQESIGSNGRYYSGSYAAQQFRLLGPTNTGTATVSLQTYTGSCNSYVFAIPGAIAGNGFFGGAVAATGTATTVPDSIQGNKQADVSVTWSGITGSPTGCEIIEEGSTNGTTYIPALVYNVTPGTNAIFAYTPNVAGTGQGAMGLAVEFVYFCTGYPSGGTITLGIVYK